MSASRDLDSASIATIPNTIVIMIAMASNVVVVWAKRLRYQSMLLISFRN